MDIYKRDVRIQVVKLFYGGYSGRKIRQLLTAALPDIPISFNSIYRFITNFEKHGCVSCRGHKLRKTFVKPENEIREMSVCAIIEENPVMSLKQISKLLGISRGTVQDILRKNGYKFYKIVKTHDILLEDYIKRMEFCECVMEMANSDKKFIRNIFFTGVSAFQLHFRHDPVALPYWCREDPGDYVTLRKQEVEEFEVWAGILGDNVVGPFFIEGSLDEQKYLELLKVQIIPSIRKLQKIQFDKIWYQQDCGTYYNTTLIQEYLSNVFPNRIISKQGTIPWPSRSPDLAPVEFLWGYVKSRVYIHEETKFTNFDELKSKILDAFDIINSEMLDNMRTSFYDRLGFCLAAAGELFENLL